MCIQFTLFPAVSHSNQAVEYIGMDVHDRYCQVAILDDDTDNPDECRIRAERAELESSRASIAAHRLQSKLRATTGSSTTVSNQNLMCLLPIPTKQASSVTRKSKATDSTQNVLLSSYSSQNLRPLTTTPPVSCPGLVYIITR